MTEEQENKRRLRRMRAFKGARFLVQGYSGSGIDCTIVDLHSHGARVRFTDPFPIGKEEVELLIFPETVRVTGRLAWQRGTDIGIEFDEPLPWMTKHDKALSKSA